MKTLSRCLITIGLLSFILLPSCAVIPHGTRGHIGKGMTRSQVMDAWGPPVSCSRAYGTDGRDTVCLYQESSTIIGGRTSYTHRDYNSVHYRDGVVVDWQLH